MSPPPPILNHHFSSVVSLAQLVYPSVALPTELVSFSLFLLQESNLAKHCLHSEEFSLDSFLDIDLFALDFFLQFLLLMTKDFTNNGNLKEGHLLTVLKKLIFNRRIMFNIYCCPCVCGQLEDHFKDNFNLYDYLSIILISKYLLIIQMVSL